jgi:hypothetical protein
MVPHNQLTVGIYPLGEADAHSLQPALAVVFTQFKDQIDKAKNQGRLNDADAFMIVEDWQADLKRVTFRIVWTDPVDGMRKTHERIVHLHRIRKALS